MRQFIADCRQKLRFLIANYAMWCRNVYSNIEKSRIFPKKSFLVHFKFVAINQIKTRHKKVFSGRNEMNKSDIIFLKNLHFCETFVDLKFGLHVKEIDWNRQSNLTELIGRFSRKRKIFHTSNMESSHKSVSSCKTSSPWFEFEAWERTKISTKVTSFNFAIKDLRLIFRQLLLLTY